MTSPQEKEEKTYYLDVFRSTFPDFPEGTIESNRESPDFVVRTTDKNIGIEFINLYGEARPPLQAPPPPRSKLAKIVAEACRTYETMNLPPVRVFFGFSWESVSERKIHSSCQSSEQCPSFSLAGDREVGGIRS